MAHPELGLKILNRVAEDVGYVAVVESTPRQDGRNMTMVLHPVRKDGRKAKSDAPAPKHESASPAPASAAARPEPTIPEPTSPEPPVAVPEAPEPHESNGAV